MQYLQEKYCAYLGGTEFHLMKIRRGPKLEGCAFVNFGNSSGTEEESSQKRGEKDKKTMLPGPGIEPGTCR